MFDRRVFGLNLGDGSSTVVCLHHEFPSQIPAMTEHPHQAAGHIPVSRFVQALLWLMNGFYGGRQLPLQIQWQSRQISILALSTLRPIYLLHWFRFAPPLSESPEQLDVLYLRVQCFVIRLRSIVAGFAGIHIEHYSGRSVSADANLI